MGTRRRPESAEPWRSRPRPVGRDLLPRQRCAARGSSPGEQVHVGVAVDLASGQLVMDLADQPTVLLGRRAAPPPRHHVVDFQPRRGTAHAAPIHGPLALPAVARPHRTLHRRGDVLGLRRPRALLRPLHLSPAAGLLLQLQIQRRLDHLLLRRARLHVPLSPAGRLELVEELARHGQVDAALVGRQRLDPHRRGRARLRPRAGQGSFVRTKLGPKQIRPHHRHHLPPGDHPRRQDRRRHHLRLPLRHVEEPGQGLRPVLRGHHPGQLDDARDAWLAFPERLDHLGEALDEPGGDLAEVRRPVGEAQLPLQVVEEARMAQFPPEPPPVEVCEGHQEIGHGALLVAQQGREVAGGFAGLDQVRVVHGSTLARKISASPDARGSPGTRLPARRSRTPPGTPRVAARRDAAAAGPFLAPPVRGT